MAGDAITRSPKELVDNNSKTGDSRNTVVVPSSFVAYTLSDAAAKDA